jgi:hypothetical protein
MDVNGFITVLPKIHKKQKVVKYFCTLYKCMVGDIEEYQDGEKHSQLLDIMEILPILQHRGIGMYLNMLLLLTCCYSSLLVAAAPPCLLLRI